METHLMGGARTTGGAMRRRTMNVKLDYIGRSKPIPVEFDDPEAPTGAVAGFVVIGVWSLFVGFVLGWLVGRW